MGIGNRVLSLIKAKVSGFLATHEDPETLLTQTIEEMERELIQHKNAIANVGASYLENQDRLAQVNQEIALWHQRGVLALEANNMELAQHAISKKHEAEALQQTISNSLAIIAPKFKEYQARYQDLAAKVSQYKSQKSELTMQVRAAKTEQELDKALTGEFGTAFRQFEDLQTRIKQFEYQSRASSMLSASYTLSDRAYAQLETSQKLQQLQQKQTHYLPSQTTKRTVVTTVTTNAKIPAIDPIPAIAPIEPIAPMEPINFEEQFRQLEMMRR